MSIHVIFIAIYAQETLGRDHMSRQFCDGIKLNNMYKLRERSSYTCTRICFS